MSNRIGRVTSRSTTRRPHLCRVLGRALIRFGAWLSPPGDIEAENEALRKRIRELEAMITHVDPTSPGTAPGAPPSSPAGGGQDQQITLQSAPDKAESFAPDKADSDLTPAKAEPAHDDSVVLDADDLAFQALLERWRQRYVSSDLDD
ncbi:unnamed protein product (mitochondrion) [Plasmodiophora brassicae]|uniref:Uncharacterized protein n=1 Tax=Plasmodiophora brassicae TaxID=37360 RepID=A0A0G4IX27_PLABS|nr:hypothetical protein PBRA_007619 [Plasmodiophora brassicae]SPQ99519.1 unnamed protein product [Plasmodiophora brassicae]